MEFEASFPPDGKAFELVEEGEGLLAEHGHRRRPVAPPCPVPPASAAILQWTMYRLFAVPPDRGHITLFVRDWAGHTGVTAKGG
ncbi:hypothetical protein [Streptomyces sp. F-1]|uniref:hypothetical protein n=1 Tax=Streptomyces sp. F-1 TaxID=463642 RepID=UPI0011614E85|nr:hypothetical protein [Streptomyces sp. F-1]